MNQPVAISGAGILCAPGMSCETAFNTIRQGNRSPQPPVAFSSEHNESFPVFEILTPLPSTLYKGVELLRTAKLALYATTEALADAGLNEAILQTCRVGVCIGTTVGSTLDIEGFYRQLRDGHSPDMTPIVQSLFSNPAAALVRAYQLNGPCQTVVNACASGTDAIGLGSAWIRAGLCDIALVGGADELCRTTYNGFSSLMINDSSPCKPFDLHRKGLNLGEGAGIMVLESAQNLAKRGKQPRGYVLGYGNATDAHHLTAPHPQGRGLRRALAEAMTGASLRPQHMAFINAHGTGTPDNDRIESQVLADIFPNIPFVSTKGHTGHTLGAAGAIEAIFTLLGLEQGVIPASAGFSTPDPKLPVSPVNKITPIHNRIGISESLAFGGNNSAIIIGLEKPE